ncbi:MFS transporter [Propionibacterium freudenreichii]|uniref:MFS transporter n=1 Tax=Propionibacterium freudenreichii TaxID=1744 RepID=UPI000A535A83|nr:MFS transporter [Propionibacterium freudenreichii]PWM97744.1 MAG: MFS transporter [Propionibacterium sp.]MCT2976989.1 MFS transporter [Propionibacterium freudenreichii]MCT2977306.1 MFS transporter [Propionibacterium freudenreichii]MCT2985129.1 MFS transporter [Propionibacterium freudenreichii]
MRTRTRQAATADSAQAGYAPGSREYRRVVVALTCAGLATFAQLYSPQGILPLISARLHVTAAHSALLISAATIGLAAGALPWAWLGDRIGRLTAMKSAMAAATLCGALGLLMPGFGAVLALRVAEGFALGGVPVLAIAYLGDQVSPAFTARAAAVYVSGTSIGGLAGRLVAAPIAEWFGWRIGMASVLGFAAVATAVFMVIAPAVRTPGRPEGKGHGTRRAALRALLEPGLLALYAVGFLLMGGFVAVYNYLAFRLRAAPFGLPTTVTSLLFLAYLAGTVSSQRAGRLAGRRGRLGVLLGAIAVFILGVGLTLVPALPVIVVGLVVLTAGFFAAHAIASGWAGVRAPAGGAQAPALYNVAYYAGSSVMGWFGGIVFVGMGWVGLVGLVAVLAAAAAGLAVSTLRGAETVG